MVLRYDGSLAGFLCLAGRTVKEHLEVTRVIRNGITVSGDLFNDELSINTDRIFAAKVASGLETKLGKQFLSSIGQALFSEEDGIEIDLIQLIRRALKEGRNIMQQLANPLIHRVDRATQRTARERYRLLGLLRFTQLTDGSYLARIEPRYNVVPLLGSHFSRRLGGQRWLIVDLKRSVGIWGGNSQWELVENIEIPTELPLSNNEQQIVDLWRGFYKSISNPDRHNPQLRQQFMPKMYWTYLTEMQTDYEKDRQT